MFLRLAERLIDPILEGAILFAAAIVTCVGIAAAVLLILWGLTVRASGHVKSRLLPERR